MISLAVTSSSAPPAGSKAHNCTGWRALTWRADPAEFSAVKIGGPDRLAPVECDVLADPNADREPISFGFVVERKLSRNQ